MKGQLTVESQEDYEAWLDQLAKDQFATTPGNVAKAETK
jgi:hypothetical protein